eukprot:13908507-Ditylum_brightwellii.AAC.1
MKYGLHESKIMEKSINALLHNNFIEEIAEGKWLSQATLAPKPHQEAVTNVNGFIWQFCVNYIPLNQITKIITYPIPRCNNDVSIGFGKAMHYILLDAFSGYHQIKMDAQSAIKTAFARPHRRKYMYKIMPFNL